MVFISIYIMSDSKSCVYCNQEAKYYCTCMNPNIYFCSRDRETHESSPGDHPIRLNKQVDIFKPNPIFKRNLIKEILKSRLSAEAQVNNAIKASAKMIELITKGTKETMVKLHQFVSLCNDILN